EEEVRKAKDEYANHYETYKQQYDRFRAVNPDGSESELENFFGPYHVQRGDLAYRQLRGAEIALKKAQATAKKAGVLDPNSPDQESDFFSVKGEGPHREHPELMIKNFNRKRIQQWMEDPEKTSRHDKEEIKFALS
ncbi:hypothetical protein BU26DRAFT_386390, partial [Trematosphaeria pertusa]